MKTEDTRAPRALSVRQPWAWLIVNGHKDVENRTRCYHYTGRLLIHASKVMTRDDYATAHATAELQGVTLPPPDQLWRGGIVGEVTVTRTVTHSTSPWFFGPYGLELKDAKPLPVEPCKGALGFFTPKLKASLEGKGEVKA